MPTRISLRRVGASMGKLMAVPDSLAHGRTRFVGGPGFWSIGGVCAASIGVLCWQKYVTLVSEHLSLRFLHWRLVAAPWLAQTRRASSTHSAPRARLMYPNGTAPRGRCSLGTNGPLGGRLASQSGTAVRAGVLVHVKARRQWAQGFARTGSRRQDFMSSAMHCSLRYYALSCGSRNGIRSRCKACVRSMQDPCRESRAPSSRDTRIRSTEDWPSARAQC